MDVLEFRAKIERAWSHETSYDPDQISWSGLAFGQCAVTAALFWEHFGGGIRKGVVKDYGSHYWNHTFGSDIDLTWRQFPIGSVLMPEISIVQYPKLAESIKPRLDLLRERFDAQ